MQLILYRFREDYDSCCDAHARYDDTYHCDSYCRLSCRSVPLWLIHSNSRQRKQVMESLITTIDDCVFYKDCHRSTSQRAMQAMRDPPTSASSSSFSSSSSSYSNCPTTATNTVTPFHSNRSAYSSLGQHLITCGQAS